MDTLFDTIGHLTRWAGQTWTTLETSLSFSTWGVPVGRILLAAAVFAVFFVMRRPQRFVLMALMGRLANRSIRDLDPAVRDALKGPAGIVPVALGAFFAFEVMQFDQNGAYAELARHIVATLALTAVFWALFELAGPFVTSLQIRSPALSPTMADVIRHTLKGAVVLLAGAVTLEVWGVQIGALLAGMGIIGAAVAIGAQDLFKNLVGGFLILVEKRFKYGDWIEVAGVIEGTVEYIGVRSSRIRRFDDASVDVPNNIFSENALVNYTKMRRRRINWTIGVPYSTSVAQLQQVRDGIDEYIRNSADLVQPEQAPTHIRVEGFGGSSINIMVYCFSITTSWREWLEVREQLAFAVMDIVATAGTSFAFPSRSLYLETVPSELFLPPVDGRPRIEPAPSASPGGIPAPDPAASGAEASPPAG